MLHIYYSFFYIYICCFITSARDYQYTIMSEQALRLGLDLVIGNNSFTHLLAFGHF